MAEHKIPVGLSDGAKTILALRDTSKRLGVIHDVQAKNLRIWAVGALELASVEVRVSVIEELLEFHCVFKGEPPANLDIRLNHLDRWSRLLLGDSYRIQVIVGDDVIWDERQEKPWPSTTLQKKSDKP